jgi:hypothetical protein
VADRRLKNINAEVLEGRAKRKDDRAIDAYPLPGPEYPFSSHVFGATDGDTRDRLSIKHSEKRLAGRFYLLLFLQFHNCSDKLIDARSFPVPE